MTTLAVANKIKWELVIICWYGCRIDEQVKWDTIFVSKTSNDGIGGGGRVKRGGGGSRDIIYNNQTLITT